MDDIEQVHQAANTFVRIQSFFFLFFFSALISPDRNDATNQII